MAKYHIYTDGSSRGNPGAGGWGMIVMNEEDTEIIFMEHDTDDFTTNNRMELSAMLCALQYASENPQHHFVVYSDSAYVVNSCNTWRITWAANGWKNSKKQTVENLDYMKEIHSYLSRDFFNVEIKKCSGHTGDTGNELADAAATCNWKKYREIIEGWDIIERDNVGENWSPID